MGAIRNVRSIASSSAWSVVRYGWYEIIAKETHAATTIAEFLYRWVLDCTTGIADAEPTLLWSGMSRRGVVVGCSGCHLIR